MAIKPFKEFIQEKSFQTSDIPKYFFVAVEAHPEWSMEGIKNLQKNKLSGVSGVSADPSIIKDFFGMGNRYVLLMMPGKEFVVDNALSRILYNNPDFLFSDDMKALQRIWSKRSKDLGFWDNLMNAFNSAVKQNPQLLEKFGPFIRILNYSGGRELVGLFQKDNPSPKHNSTLFAKYLLRVFNNPEKHGLTEYHYIDLGKQKFTIKDMHNLLQGVADHIHRVYGNEAEWIIKDKNLNIPKNTKMAILVNYLPDNPIMMIYNIIQKEFKGKIAGLAKFPSKEFREWFEKNTSRLKKLISKAGRTEQDRIPFVIVSDQENLDMSKQWFEIAKKFKSKFSKIVFIDGIKFHSKRDYKNILNKLR